MKEDGYPEVKNCTGKPDRQNTSDLQTACSLQRPIHVYWLQLLRIEIYFKKELRDSSSA